MNRVLAWLLVVAIALLSQAAGAVVCQQSGRTDNLTTGGSYTTQALAEQACASATGAYLTGHSDQGSVVDVYGACHVLAPDKKVMLKWQTNKSLQYSSGACQQVIQNVNQDFVAFSYATASPCTAPNAPNRLDDLWSDNGAFGTLVANGTTICDGSCAYTVSYNGNPHYVAAFDRWTVQSSSVSQHLQCSNSAPPPAPDTTPPPPLPDADSDGTPDAHDPKPNDANNDAAPPPPDQNPGPAPTTGAATNAGLANLGATLGDKLNHILGAIEGAEIANAAAAAAAAAANAAALGGLGTIFQGGQGGCTQNCGSTGTDMGPTNALLTIANTLATAGNGKLDSLVTNTTRGVVAADSPCAVAPVGIGGDPVQNALLMQVWRERCFMEQQLTQEVNDLHSPLVDQGPHADGFVSEGQGDPAGSGGLDDSGFGWSRACPETPSFTVFGHTFSFPNTATGALCSWMQIGGALVLIFAALASAKIIGSA